MIKEALFLVAAVSAWVVLAFKPAIAQQTVTLDLQDANSKTYARFIQSLREQLKNPRPDPKVNTYGVPMMPKPTDPPSYIYAELKSSDKCSVTLAINKNDVYVVAYSDRTPDRSRKHFFEDAPHNAESIVFKRVPIKREIGYGSNYERIQKEAKADSRAKFGPGKKMFESYVKKICEAEELKNKNFIRMEAEFILVFAQAVSEAVRFKYIEEQIAKNLLKTDQFKFDPKVIYFEGKWGKLSECIVSGDLEYINKKIKLQDENGKPWKVENMKEIAKDMGLLKNADGTGCVTKDLELSMAMMNWMVANINNATGSA